MANCTIADVIEQYEGDLLSDWIRRQQESLAARRDLISEAELRTDSRNLLSVLRETVSRGGDLNITHAEWAKARDMLGDLSRRRVVQGFTPSETATFVFSLKQPLFDRIVNASSNDSQAIADLMWSATLLLDSLGLYTVEFFQKSREQLITRQQQEMLELSTPVVELWNGILALPLIGTLDSNRTQVVMQNLLEAIVAKETVIAIIDITGVPTVDTLVAQHLLKTVAAARLMGAECLISGIRPQIAQTIIHLGVDLGGVTTKATLADAFQIAMRKLGLAVTKA
ncbi:MAG TPA: STAS domain-containing protein [Bryobacteraceae bacterium]|nr:STAS domain-containing protein [Bryobacteraceae bacterium]